MNIKTADRLKALRQNAGLSQEALADKLNVSRQAVSKWERAEASPDIDNLIALSKIYNVSIDNILLGDESTVKPEQEKPEEQSTPHDYVDISLKDGIHVHSADGDRVDVSFKGIHVHPADGNDEYHSDRIFSRGKDKKSPAHRFFTAFPFPALVVVAYLLLGFLTFSGFALGWPIFLTIPLYYTLVDAIFERDYRLFAYPVLVVLVYLILGLMQSSWHPSWVIFLTIPIYYCFPHCKKDSKENCDVNINVNGVEENTED